MFPFLSHHGVLGLNARNLLYIKPFNPRKAVAFADDKRKTKAFLAARGVPTAKIYAKIESRQQLKSFNFDALPDECVLKPNYGAGGEGIIILQGRRNGDFLEQGKTPMTRAQLIAHIEDILDGRFSVNGELDTAFFEKLLVADDAFAPFQPAGLPDVRIIVFNLVPVMAMLRIPTFQSRGKANVHLGGIGIGIDIAKGTTTFATQFNRLVHQLPHGVSPSGIAIPQWEELLLIASRIQYMTNIGYIAVDLTVDHDLGPVLLEVNARAGLMVQVANLAPLRSRLERVKGLVVPSPEKGVRIAQELFGQKLSREGKTQDDDRVLLSLYETVTVSGEGMTIPVPSLIRPTEERTYFSEDLLAELALHNLAELDDDEEQTYRIKFSIGGKKILTIVRAGLMPDPSVRAVIGRRDLQGFLIDPTKGVYPAASFATRQQVRGDLRAVDKFLGQADRDLLLLKYLKPINLSEERLQLLRDPSYNPQFHYAALELNEIEERLHETLTDISPLGSLLEKKRRELLLRIHLLRSRGDSIRFTGASQALFGSIDPFLMQTVQETLAAQVACALPPDPDSFLSTEESADQFREALERYSLHDWQVSIRPALVADCTVGAKYLYLREGARFSPEHVAGLIAHEIETHILCAENGSHQPYALLQFGTANYLETQEGLAIYNQNRILSPYHEKRFSPAKSILGLAFALEHSFAATRRYLQEELHYSPEKSITKTLQLKRGLSDTSLPGALTKVLVYFRGHLAIENFVRSGGDLRRLYIGKVSLEDLPTIENIEGLRPPVLLPSYLLASVDKKVKTKKKTRRSARK